MSPRLFLSRCVEPGLLLLPGYMVSDAARVMLLAIAGQECNLQHRAQLGGSARGYWQFEQGGVDAVLRVLPVLAQMVLDTLDIASGEALLAIKFNDPLACAFARLLLWADPAPLPAVGNELAAWTYYLRNWKPGKPDITRWGTAYATAVSTVQAES